jgi:hypothetical protein
MSLREAVLWTLCVYICFNNGRKQAYKRCFYCIVTITVGFGHYGFIGMSEYKT